MATGEEKKEMPTASAKEILQFWFGPLADAPPQDKAMVIGQLKTWFGKDEKFDAQIRQRFGDLIFSAAKGELVAWEDSPEGALALIILLDQFSRNCFRGTPQAFAQDGEALAIAKRMIEKGFDLRLRPILRSFVYLTFEHSESMEDQESGITCFTKVLEDCVPGGGEHFLAEKTLQFAESHREIIARFGRYPHRNEILNRESTAEEIEFMKTHKGF